jgi:pimeloyl-ACP methyl ester carboxylesterase
MNGACESPRQLRMRTQISRYKRSQIAAVTGMLILLYFMPASGQANPVPKSGQILWLTANGLRIKTVIYRGAGVQPRSRPVLMVVLHGDLPSPSYHYEFSRRAALQMNNVVVAALLRPGYTDGAGDRSDGEMGLTTGDNYTPEVVDTVAEIVRQLKQQFHPASTVLAGHSGGAAITADLLGRWPALANAALLVSCPCDVPAWRKHMLDVQKNPIWLAPVKSLSPMDLVGKVPHSVRVRMLVGGDDPVAPPELSQRYADALKKQGDAVSLRIVPGLKHNILLEPPVFDALKALVESERQ